MSQPPPSPAATRQPAQALPTLPADGYLAGRREVAYYMRRLYRLGLTTTSGGNLSVRVAPGIIAVTPAGNDKGRIQADQVGLMTLAGDNLTPHLRASSEVRMHLRLYEVRPDVQAIVHAHPVTASAFTAAKTPINVRLLAESYAVLGDPVLAEYVLTGTDALAAVVAEKGRRANCILLENHGITCLGDSLLRAFDRLELIEAAARMTLVARQLEGVRNLDPAQCRDLDRLMGRYE